jgi:cytochrome c biogenesis protein
MSATPSSPNLQPSTSPNARLSAWIDVLGSMRFAISSLSIVAIASIIGTVLNQREPFLNYVNQFGPVWAQYLSWAGVVEVYNAWWFLLVLAFLVISTSICVTRNSPKMIREMSTWREAIRASSLKSQHHHDEITTSDSPEVLLGHQSEQLQRLGYRLKLDQRSDGMMLVGKQGAVNRLGYIVTHVGIVVIALGGMLDSELPLKTYSWWLNKQPMLEMPVGEKIPESVKLPTSNPSFRSNLFVPEGGTASLALINTHGGRYVQELPFAVELKKFNVEYYSTGMPKLFASDVVIIDKDTGAKREATIKVNEPLHHRGMTIYQSSFDDGGSKLRLKGFSLQGAQTIDIPIEVGSSIALERTGATNLKLELTGFRAINVENVAQIDATPKDQRKFQESVATVLSPTAGGRSKGLRNVGPSIQYRLRDAAGQAREFNVYQLPVEIDGYPMFLAGVRDSVNDQFQFLRIPADDKGELTEFFRLRKALSDTNLIRLAANRFAEQSAPRANANAGNGTGTSSSDSAGSSMVAKADPVMQQQLAQSAERALSTFAGGGLQSVADYIGKNVPEAEREKASEMILRVLSSGMWELWQAARKQDGLAPAKLDENNGRYIQLAQLALSDTYIFGAPLLFQLDEFKEVKASVFQVTRSPGKNIVLTGSISLLLGIFAMFYIRERRVWCWISKNAEGKTAMLYAMSSTRPGMAIDQDFAKLKNALRQHYV